MTGNVFEADLSEIFARSERRLGSRLALERTKAENLQSQDTRRVAFILTEAIEAELQPAVKEALASYDAAINRPILPNARWETLLRQRVGQSVDAAVKLALNLDKASHPWKPLLSAEAPKLRARLTESAEAHFRALSSKRNRRGKASGGASEWALRAALLAIGVGVGFVISRLLA